MAFRSFFPGSSSLKPEASKDTAVNMAVLVCSGFKVYRVRGLGSLGFREFRV